MLKSTGKAQSTLIRFRYKKSKRGDANKPINKYNLYCLDIFFKQPKPRKWTWQSTNGKTKN